ncbi:MAG: 4Fe-4S dicluster domain-containing protein [bacterium]
MKKGTAEQELHRLFAEHGLVKCIQCGKCTSACTMTEIFEDFKYSWAPRTIIEKALLGEDLFSTSSIWKCLTCEVCSVTCPSGVHFKEFIGSLRDLAVEKGHTGNLRYCERCGKPLLPRHTSAYIQARSRDYTPDPVLLCERCKRYMLAQEFKDSLRTRKKVVPTWPKRGKRRSKRRSLRKTS